MACNILALKPLKLTIKTCIDFHREDQEICRTNVTSKTVHLPLPPANTRTRTQMSWHKKHVPILSIFWWNVHLKQLQWSLKFSLTISSVPSSVFPCFSFRLQGWYLTPTVCNKIQKFRFRLTPSKFIAKKCNHFQNRYYETCQICAANKVQHPTHSPHSQKQGG